MTEQPAQPETTEPEDQEAPEPTPEVSEEDRAAAEAIETARQEGPPPAQSEPEVIAVASDPFPVTADQADVDRIREDLITSLRDQATEAGWAPEEIQATLRVDDTESTEHRVLRAEAVRSLPGPPQWHRVRTDSGYLLRLVGPDDQPILYSSREYPDPEAAEDTLDLVRRSLQPVGVVGATATTARFALTDVDERENPQ